MRMIFRDERDLDLLKAYNRVVKSFGKEAPYISRKEMVKRAIESGAERYYVTYEEALRNIRRIMNGKPLKCKNPCKRAMYLSLYEAVKRYRENYPELPFNRLLIRVLSEEKAPCFFITPERASLLLNTMQRKSAV